MKGVIPNCLGQLVVNKFGKDKWEAALKLAGLETTTTFLAFQDVPDEAVLKVVDSVCKVLNITLEQAADAFGEYWVCTYGPGIYKTYYQRAASAKEFLLKMDEVHRITTESIPNAQPPRFEYTWPDNKTLIMKYKSKRNLSVFMVGLVKGVGKYYKESLQVSKQGDDIKIVFF
ncbi:MAG: hypothetical protein A2010_04740 [Nitrospirae bacterium GWD2_57_9]|nr:MAG: hypothetical protein A2010_04740 [Nitrospirae bacterium GWD2_57_9]